VPSVVTSLQNVSIDNYH